MQTISPKYGDSVTITALGSVVGKVLAYWQAQNNELWLVRYTSDGKLVEAWLAASEFTVES